MKTKSILLIDTDGDCAALVARAAADSDYALRWIKTSPEAFAVLKRQLKELAVVIVDVDPGAHGLALLEALSSCAERPPMLVLTALEETYMEHIAKKHGAMACLGKPISVTRLRVALEKVHEKRSLSCDYWGHLTAPPIDNGSKVKVATRGFSRKVSVAPTKRSRFPVAKNGSFFTSNEKPEERKFVT